MIADRGLRVIDVSDPTSPVERGNLEGPVFPDGVTVAGGLAYIAGGEAGLRVIDGVPEPGVMPSVLVGLLGLCALLSRRRVIPRSRMKTTGTVHAGRRRLHRRDDP